LASIYYLERKDLHIALLLDEPDSHLNGKVQRALVTVLRDLSQNENMQTFIVTHNEKLIYSAENNELLHIEKNESDIKPLPSENYLKTLIALDYYDLNKHWLMVEGVTDQIILDKAFQVLYEKPLFGYFNVKVASGAKNLNGLLGKCIESSEFIQDKTRTVIGLFDGDREGIGQCDGVKQTENVKCLILPMPEHRENFKGHLEIEHYFSDNFVETNQLKGEPVAVDSQVYRPKKLKVCELEKALDFLDAQFFEPFRLIFEAIAEKSNNQEFNELVCPDSSNQAVA
jgi:energy-coupling factor transporter ATP-binding protein EcfA2